MMIEPFGPQLLERYLRDNELRFLVDQDGDFLVDFYGEEVNDYRVQLSAEGVDREVLCVRIGTDVTYTEALRDRIEGFVAGWNRRTRWPKVYVADDRRGRGMRVVGENSFLLTAGIHQKLLDDFITMSIMSGRQMLVELGSAVTTVSDGEFDNFLREAG